MNRPLLLVITASVVIIATCALYVTLRLRHEGQERAAMSCLENAQAHQFDMLTHGGTAAQQDAANAKAFQACSAKGTK
jgi:hypothetical protein